MKLFLQKVMINVTTLVLKLSISNFLDALHPMESISLNSFVLLEHLAMLLTSTLAINYLHRNFLTFCLPTGHFWATSSTPLSANGPLLDHLFGFDFFLENSTAFYILVVFNVKKNPFSAKYFWWGLFSWNALGIRGDYMKVLSVKNQHAVAMFFPAFCDLTS